MLIGVPERLASGEYFNSVISLGTAPPQSYRKSHLVPFGEFIPLRPLLGGIVGALAIPLQDFARGGPAQRPLAVAVLGCAVLALKATSGSVGAHSRDWMRDALRFDRALLDAPDRLLPHAAALVGKLALPLLPLLFAALAACLLAPMAMGGIRFASKSLQPDFGRLNPVKGFARVYGAESLAELVRSLLRVALIGGAGADSLTVGTGAAFERTSNLTDFETKVGDVA